MQWDEKIDERSAYEWLKWKNILLTLENFSDASESEYKQVSYLRMENENGDMHCCLIFGKSRVAPVKYVSIQKLELTATTLSVKISMMLKEEWGIRITSDSF